MTEINLGDQVVDSVSGLKGIATARVDYMNGCIQYGVSAPIGKDGKVPETVFIDHTQLAVLSKQFVTVKRASTGGPSHTGL